jgi:uncharacterized MAPEG superfamily protein
MQLYKQLEGNCFEPDRRILLQRPSNLLAITAEPSCAADYSEALPFAQELSVEEFIFDAIICIRVALQPIKIIDAGVVMTIAYWCVLIAIALPYVSTVWAKASAGGFKPKHNHDPRAFLATVQGMAKRANNAQQNGFEITPAFAAAVIIGHLAGGAEQALLDQLAMAFVLSRVLYTLCYIADWALLRSLVWFVGLGLIISLFVLSA